MSSVLRRRGDARVQPSRHVARLAMHAGRKTRPHQSCVTLLAYVLPSTASQAMTAAEILTIGIVTVLGATVHGSTGIGLGLVAGPALATIDSQFLPGPLMLVSIVISIRHLLTERQNVDMNCVRRLLYGLPFGVGAAVLVLITIDERMLAIGIGALVVATSLLLLSGLHFPRTPTTEFLGGAGAAFGSLAASLPGPPLVMSLHDLPGEVMRPTVASIASLLSLITVIALAPIGLFGTTEAGLAALLVPFALIGLLLARVVRPWLDRQFFRPVILCIALGGGLALVIRNL